MSRKIAAKQPCPVSELKDLVVFDLETTGLSPKTREIIQVAAVRIRRGRVLKTDRFFSYVKPRHRISSFITGYTGITNEDVSDAPRVLPVLRRFSKFCGSAMLVAHNGSRFDMPFIVAACRRGRARKRQVGLIDSIHLSWAVWGARNGYSHRLESVLSRLRISRRGQRLHDARVDAELTAEAVLKLLARLKRTDPEAEIGMYAGCLPY